METKRTFVSAAGVNVIGAERRASHRIRERFAARVRGVTSDGRNFEEETVLENLSTAGMFLALPREVKIGAKLDVLIRLRHACADWDVPTGVVALDGVVLRTEPRARGIFGVAAAIRRHRFM